MKKINQLLIIVIAVSIVSCSSALTLSDYDHIREVVNRNDVKTYQPKFYDNGGEVKTNIINKKQVAVEKTIIRQLIQKEKISLTSISSSNTNGETSEVIKNEIREINSKISNLERRLDNISNDNANAHEEMLSILAEINDLKCKLIDGTKRLLIKTNKIFGDVSFKMGEKSISNRGKEEIQNVVNSIESDIRGWKNYLNSCNEKIFEDDVYVVVINVDGYADAVGSSKFNMKLSDERAIEVKKELEKMFYKLVKDKKVNIVFNKIYARGHGEKLPPGVKSSTSNDPERRVCYILSVVGPSKILGN